MMNKRQQWEWIKANNPDLADLMRELSTTFGKLGGVNLNPPDEGWVRPELEYKPKTERVRR